MKELFINHILFIHLHLREVLYHDGSGVDPRNCWHVFGQQGKNRKTQRKLRVTLRAELNYITQITGDQTIPQPD